MFSLIAPNHRVLTLQNCQCSLDHLGLGDYTLKHNLMESATIHYISGTS